MLLPRLIPCLLFDDGGLVKTVKFSAPQYIGDPLNVVHIFNEKEVDEIVFLDIGASPKHKGPDYDTLRLIASEAFIPLAYGGGVESINQARMVFECGFEKVVLNTAAHRNPGLVSELAGTFGSQSVVASIDVKKDYLVNTRFTPRADEIKNPAPWWKRPCVCRMRGLAKYY